MQPKMNREGSSISQSCQLAEVEPRQPTSVSTSLVGRSAIGRCPAEIWYALATQGE